MAFTEAQKVDIRHYLGYPNVALDGNMRLEGAIDLVGAQPDAQAKAEAIMAEIAAVLANTGGTTGNSLATAGIAEIDKKDVVFDVDGSGNNAVLKGSQQVGQQWVNDLSNLFGVIIANDLFGRSGYSGDWWSHANVQMGPNGGLVPLG